MLIYIEPVPKPRQTRADKWRQRPCVMRYRAFADKLRLLVGPVPQGAVSVEVVFYAEAPASRRKGKSRVLEGQTYLGKPDIDNSLKAILDALWPDGDEQVWRVVAEKRWTLGKARIELNFSPQGTG